LGEALAKKSRLTNPMREVTLQADTRPVRLSVLVASRDDVSKAVELFTHVPGGLAGGLVAVPQADSDVSAFRNALAVLDPDVLLIPSDLAVPDDLARELNQLPLVVQRLRPKDVQEHVNGPNHLRLRSGSIPHIGRLLTEQFPSPQVDTTIRVVEAGGRFDFLVELQQGKPTRQYAAYLAGQLDAKLLSRPESACDLTRLAILMSGFLGPLALTLHGFGGRVDESSSDWDTMMLIARANDPTSVQLFLDDGSLDVPVAFWNVRRVSAGANKIILPMADFFDNAGDVLATIAEAIPFADLVIVCPGTHEQATENHARVRDALSSDRQKAGVRVWHSGLRYATTPGGVFAHHREPVNRSVGDDGSIRITLLPPRGHDRNGDAFGYDASVEFSDGRRLSMPATHLTSLLLGNEAERLHRARTDTKLGSLWLRQNSTVRIGRKGIAGQAATGEQCFIFFHSPSVIFANLLGEQNITLRPNTHTRYADGFVRRFGAIADVLAMVRNGGDEIITALGSRDAEQCGMSTSEVIAYLMKHRGRDRKQAQSIVDGFLAPLLSAGLVRRGYALRCDQCLLRDWYPISEFGEFVECHGCGRRFQLTDHQHIKFCYTANELARRFIREGGPAVLMAAAVLEKLDDNGVLQFGGDLLETGNDQVFAEADILWLTRDVFAIVECKAWYSIGEKELEAIRQSLERGLIAAVRTGANVLALAVSTASSYDGVKELVSEFANQTQHIGIGVHLLLNGQLCVNGTGVEVPKEKLQDVRVAALRGARHSEPSESFVGDSAPSSIPGGVRPVVTPAILKAWDTSHRRHQGTDAAEHDEAGEVL
jgi:hypothetical protein